MANRVLYCARETEGEEEVVEDSECRDFPEPTAVVSCNTHSCPARYITPDKQKHSFFFQMQNDLTTSVIYPGGGYSAHHPALCPAIWV